MHEDDSCGFPHSEICGSRDACSSPQLIAACHVLHRLEVPRHPPCALSSLTIKFTHEQQEHLRFLIADSRLAPVKNPTLIEAESKPQLLKFAVNLQTLAQ